LVRTIACAPEPSDAISPSLFWTSIAASVARETPRRFAIMAAYATPHCSRNMEIAFVESKSI
jgi:hypothetical protein